MFGLIKDFINEKFNLIVRNKLKKIIDYKKIITIFISARNCSKLKIGY